MCIAGYCPHFSFKEWEQFLDAKFSRPKSDSNRDLECLVAEDDLLNDTELNECLDAFLQWQICRVR